jgi:hypothetical protein
MMQQLTCKAQLSQKRLLTTFRKLRRHSGMNSTYLIALVYLRNAMHAHAIVYFAPESCICDLRCCEQHTQHDQTLVIAGTACLSINSLYLPTLFTCLCVLCRQAVCSLSNTCMGHLVGRCVYVCENNISSVVHSVIIDFP